LAIDRQQDRLRVAARGADQIGAEAFLVLEQDLEQMLRRQPLMAAAQRQILGRLDKALRPFGVFFEFHGARASDEPAAAPPSGSPRGPSLVYMVWLGCHTMHAEVCERARAVIALTRCRQVVHHFFEATRRDEVILTEPVGLNPQ